MDGNATSFCGSSAYPAGAFIPVHFRPFPVEITPRKKAAHPDRLLHSQGIANTEFFKMTLFILTQCNCEICLRSLPIPIAVFLS